MLEYYVPRFIPLLLVILLFSCHKETICKDVTLSNGLYSPVVFRSGIAYLFNVEEHFKQPAIAILNGLENVESVYLIDAYRESLTKDPYYYLHNNQGNLLLIYKKDIGHVVIEDIVTRNNIERYDYINGSYASVFKIDSKSIVVKSGNAYDIKNFDGYNYSFYSLSDNLEVINQFELNLGQFKPYGIAYLGDNIFYYQGNNILYLRNTQKKNEIPLYKFDSEIVDSTTFDNRYYILLDDSLFIFNDEGAVLRGLSFSQDKSDYIADSIWINKDFISITFKNSNNYKLKVLSKSGNQVDEIKIGSWGTQGDKYAIKVKGQNYILYSKERYLHIKEF